MFVPAAVWEALMSALENLEDLAVARDFMRQRATARSPKEMGFELVGPMEGHLACGTVGRGRMAEAAEILERIEKIAR